MARQKKPTLRQTCEAQQLRIHEQAETIQQLKRQVGELRMALAREKEQAERAESLEAEVKDTLRELEQSRSPAPDQWTLPVLIGIQRAAFHLQRMGKFDSATALLALIDTVAGEGEPGDGVLGEGGLRRALRTLMDSMREIEWRKESLRGDIKELYA